MVTVPQQCAPVYEKPPESHLVLEKMSILSPINPPVSPLSQPFSSESDLGDSLSGYSKINENRVSSKGTR